MFQKTKLHINNNTYIIICNNIKKVILFNKMYLLTLINALIYIEEYSFSACINPC